MWSYFDLIGVADESHRSVYNVYGGPVPNTLTALQVGLTKRRQSRWFSRPTCASHSAVTARRPPPNTR